MGAFTAMSGPRAPERSVIVHADDTWYGHILRGEAGFFEKLGQALIAAGYAPRIVRDGDLNAVALMAQTRPQIVVGPKRHRGAHIWHAHPSYIRNYWYLDPQGYFWNSSLVEAAFDPQQIDGARARQFMRQLRQRMIGKNLSKRPQPPRSAAGLPPASVFVVTQDIEKYRDRVHDLTTEEMIRTAAAWAGHVYVKLHPLQSPERQAQITGLCDSLDNVTVQDASVHDLIAACDVVVTQNSAVGFEALMQAKPVLTCARCDYHHASLVCRDTDALAHNLTRARDFADGFQFAKYFYWFLAQQMLKPQDDDFAARAMQRLLGGQP
ncbi:hypothetical protein E4Z66_12385 [Aliishimia ponticola]|uniref:Capsular biosynthesis protein n=1 Tax=Aliishimia ponticola TaxID=2499833 RepID=A0A4S4NB12_9RHOB|nr:hypothetical protein [Aliishimia ponticola]THH35865.1 hypothetical protein E4Z66_12385 [Aliishimia ponticola]